MNRKLFLTACFVIIALHTGCASNSKTQEVPLWADTSTIEQTFPKKDYIARIGYAKDSQTSAVMAESELGSYFSHAVHSVTIASESMSNSTEKKTSVSKNLERIITVESMNRLFDVHKTIPWFDRTRKQYICCAYINRSDAWNVYERIVRDSRDKFRQFYDIAIAEKEPLRKIHALDSCDEHAADFLYKLENARLIQPGKEDVFLSDRKLAEGLELDKKAAMNSCVMYVDSKNDGGQLSRYVTSVISGEGFSVSEKKVDAAYIVFINLDYGITSHGETITAEPGLTITVMTDKREVWKYSMNLAKQSGFSEAEALVKRKIIQSAVNEVNKNFDNEFQKFLISQ